MNFGTSLMAGGKSINIGFQAVILIAFIGLMYFLLIRPQKKKEKEVKQMRNALSVGDEVVTIGGICGKIVKTKDQTLILQVGADKIKFEVTRWAISSITKKSRETVKEEKEETEERKPAPKRLKKSKKGNSEEVKENNEQAKKAESVKHEADDADSLDNAEETQASDDK